MKTIKISDMSTRDGHRFLGFDLKDCLEILGDDTEKFEWRALDVWSTPLKDANPLEDLAAIRQRVSGSFLLEASKQVTQTIDGKFAGFQPGEEIPRIVIEAVDSSFYLVHSDDCNVLQKFFRHFKSVENYAAVIP